MFRFREAEGSRLGWPVGNMGVDVSYSDGCLFRGRVIWVLSKSWKKIQTPNLSNVSFRKSDESRCFMFQRLRRYPPKSQVKGPWTSVTNT